MWRTMRLLLSGRFAEVDDAVAAAQALGADVGHPDAFFWHAAQTLQLRWDQDRLGELRPAVEALVVDSPGRPMWRAVLAAVLADQGLVDATRHEIDRIVAELAGLGLDPNPFAAALPLAEGMATLVLVADVAVAVDDTRHADLLAEALAPYAAHGVMAGPAVVHLGCVAHRLGCLASLSGDAAAAATHFAAAELHYERLGARPWLARLVLDRATAAHRVGDPAATRFAAAAQAQASELGMPGIARGASAWSPSPASARRRPTIPATRRCRAGSARWCG
jgi:hypothetical protein